MTIRERNKSSKCRSINGECQFNIQLKGKLKASFLNMGKPSPYFCLEMEPVMGEKVKVIRKGLINAS